jgi:hypothetical protein
MIFGTKRIEQLEEKVKQLGLDNDLLKNRLDAQAKLIRSLQELVYGQIKENLSLVQALKSHLKQVPINSKNIRSEFRKAKAREYARAYYQRKKAEKESAK